MHELGFQVGPCWLVYATARHAFDFEVGIRHHFEMESEGGGPKLNAPNAELSMMQALVTMKRQVFLQSSKFDMVSLGREVCSCSI